MSGSALHLTQRLAVAALLSGLLAAGCSGENPNQKKMLDQQCQKNLDCTYGLECVAKKCQWKSFGDCDGETNTSGQPQCLPGYKCRDTKCTVQCAGQSDCAKGEICRIGVCRKGEHSTRQCYDNRDCSYPETCFYGQCVEHPNQYRCRTDLECGTGFLCISGRCT